MSPAPPQLAPVGPRRGSPNEAALFANGPRRQNEDERWRQQLAAKQQRQHRNGPQPLINIINLFKLDWPPRSRGQLVPRVRPFLIGLIVLAASSISERGSSLAEIGTDCPPFADGGRRLARPQYMKCDRRRQVSEPSGRSSSSQPLMGAFESGADSATADTTEAARKSEIGQLQLQLLLDRLIPAIWPQPATSNGDEQEDDQDVEGLGQREPPPSPLHELSPLPTSQASQAMTPIKLKEQTPQRLEKPSMGEQVASNLLLGQLNAAASSSSSSSSSGGASSTKRPLSQSSISGLAPTLQRNRKPSTHSRAPYDTSFQPGPSPKPPEMGAPSISSPATGTHSRRKLAALPADAMSRPPRPTAAGSDEDVWRNRLSPLHQHPLDPLLAATSNSLAQEPTRDPIRQLVSFQANNLYYPPNEFPDPAGIITGNYQQSARPPSLHYQPEPDGGANWPATPLYQLGPSSWPLSQQQQQQPYYSLSGSNNHLSADPNQLHWPTRQPSQLGAAGSQTIIGGAPGSRPAVGWLASLLGQAASGSAGGSGGLLLGPPAVAPSSSGLSSAPSSSALASLVAFLANNKATLSNLIQLLPLVAQTIRTLPKVLAASTPDTGATNNLLYHLAAGGQASGSIEPSTTVAVSAGKTRPSNDQRQTQQQPPHQGLVQTLAQSARTKTTERPPRARPDDNVLDVATSPAQSSGSTETNLANRFKQPPASGPSLATGDQGNRRSGLFETGAKLEGQQQQQQQDSMAGPLAAKPGWPTSGSVQTTKPAGGSQLSQAAMRLMISELVRRWLTTSPVAASDGAPTKFGQQHLAGSPSSGVAVTAGLAETLLKQYLKLNAIDRARPATTTGGGTSVSTTSGLHHQLSSILAGLLQQQPPNGSRAPAGVAQMTNWLMKSAASALAQ